jgi:hypothetical protein
MESRRPTTMCEVRISRDRIGRERQVHQPGGWRLVATASLDAMPSPGMGLRETDRILRNIRLQQEHFTRQALLKLLPVVSKQTQRRRANVPRCKLCGDRETQDDFFTCGADARCLCSVVKKRSRSSSAATLTGGDVGARNATHSPSKASYTSGDCQAGRELLPSLPGFSVARSHAEQCQPGGSLGPTQSGGTPEIHQ